MLRVLEIAPRSRAYQPPNLPFRTVSKSNLDHEGVSIYLVAKLLDISLWELLALHQVLDPALDITDISKTHVADWISLK